MIPNDLLSNPPITRPLLLCLSHLRWDWVYQRPQHLMTRAAQIYDVIYWEEPLPAPVEMSRPALSQNVAGDGIVVATPLLSRNLDPAQADAAQRELLDQLLGQLGRKFDVVWYYTPMALDFAGHLSPNVVVFDSMDALSSFQGASLRLALLERRLLRQADLVFTGGRSLHEAKRNRHPSVHLFPSSVDVGHFGLARGADNSPLDQAMLPHPRIGFFGVIDERMDLALVENVSRRRPDWQIMMIGPVAKIDPMALPRHPNLHWLGLRQYGDLPAYLSGWDAGLMPFALNDATRFISPTKTPEYLAAGVPVVSTPVPDVVSDWGRDGLIGIGATPDAIIASLQAALSLSRATWLLRVDSRLALISWNATWDAMHTLITAAIDAKTEIQMKRPFSSGEIGHV